ncbi:type I restriction endonuclease [Paenibacillus sp. NPDC057886]|uniref:type I restriction endonuclease n=1 Tax=Paenibacillus sp. NPDC057886 TaxID=3346270 RepID=UPI003694656F
MKHNEDSRVKIPALLHFLRLGYTYQSKKNVQIDPKNNIFIEIFKQSINTINNKELDDNAIKELIKEITYLTENNKDKGKSFFERLLAFNSLKIIDLKNPIKNDFRVVSELTFRGERDEFRPDITILINGIPLGFVEVKKPNNQKGIQAEFERMKYRSNIEDFIPFFNQFQVLGFSNNMPYDDNARIKLQGSFYTSPNGTKSSFNNFREENELPVIEYIDENLIDLVLKDNNLMSIKETAEFETNLKPDSHVNKFITSIFSRKRLIFFIRYGIVYVDSPRDGLHKHIIRYPQLFAIDELINKIRNGLKRGVVWHTQGSGKTALAYFLSNALRDYYQKYNIITKFYFVVDRLDLLHQASTEFVSRGLTIANINSREDFRDNIKSPTIVSTGSQEGKYIETMNVVNIQKFSEDSTAPIEINKNIQRIYFLDEVHRGYKPKGTFLANLLGSDANGIFIGLTGTPILKEEFKTTDIFSDYIHKYYYNKSIADGYTLKIKKENIATHFKQDIKNLLGVKNEDKIPSKDWEAVTRSPMFIKKLGEYMVEDFNLFRNVQKDKTLGFMIVSTSSEQARAIQEWFSQNSTLKTALILYDEEGKKEKQEDFRGKRNKNEENIIESKYDGVIVFNMLLTGFDAPRLKRLYLLREIKEHSLLQTLARVNRPYKKMKYGYIVDFVDITEEYEETNRRYIQELKSDMIEDDSEDVEDLFINVEKVKEQIQSIENRLFNYMGNIENNLEAFQIQLQPLSEKKLREIKADLSEYRECYNELRMSHEDISKIPIDRISKAFYEVSNRINLKVLERYLDDDEHEDDDFNEIDFTNLIVEFLKTGEIDLEFTTENDILERVNRIQNTFSANTDQNDPQFYELKKRYKDIIRSFRDQKDTTEKTKKVIEKLDLLLNDILILNAQNNGLTSRYNGNDSCMRIHKKILRNYGANLNDSIVYQVISDVIIDMETLVGHIHRPTKVVVLHQIRKPIHRAFKKHGKILSLRQVESIAEYFVDDQFIHG